MKIKLTDRDSAEFRKFILDAARTYLHLHKNMQLPEGAVVGVQEDYRNEFTIEVDGSFKYDAFNKQWFILRGSGWEEYEDA
jgi:hypothetical protein